LNKTLARRFNRHDQTVVVVRRSMRRIEQLGYKVTVDAA